MSMRWDEIDGSFSRWTIPASKHKNGFEQVIPLIAPAQQILKARRAANPHSEWVFSNARSQSGHMTSPGRSWSRLLKKLGITSLTPHDLRRSGASHMAIAGVSLPVIGAALGHRDPRSTAIYARLSTAAVEGALNKVFGEEQHG